MSVGYEGERGGRHRFVARWYRPEIRIGRRHRFVLAVTNGRPRTEGAPFD
ncbi:hypothetical protein BH24ACT4_BH24ACT4_25010 [soil metagenome]